MVLVKKVGLLQCFKICYYIKAMYKALCQLEKKQCLNVLSFSASMDLHYLIFI